MKSIAVVVLALLACLASGKNVKYADKEFMVKQAFVFEIFQHIHQDDVFSHKYEEGRKYVIQDHYDNYNKVELVKEFDDEWTSYPIYDDEMFTIMNEDHRDMVEGLVATLILAKNFEAFKMTALWARFHVNKQMFVYAFSLACIHRPDLQGIVLPPVYEIYPYYFFGAETIQKAQNYKMHGFHNVKKVEDVYQVVIPSNYTGKFGHVNDDNLLAYFHEDVGLNAFYYYYNLDYPYWTKGAEKTPLDKDYRGALYLYLHWQILARYYMERLSHDLGEIEEFDYWTPYSAGYHTGLRYYNGIFFPNRDNNFDLYQPENFELIEKAYLYEHRLYDLMDAGRVLKKDRSYYVFPETHEYPENMNILGNIIQGNDDSMNTKYYGQYDLYLRSILNNGIPYGKYEEVLPSTLMHYETSMRDPAFYSMYKRIVKYFWHYMQQLGHYTEKELKFDGVKIEGVEMDKLVTYYDVFDADITNVVDVEVYDEKHSTDFSKFGRVAHHEGTDFVIKARQYRLNHLPFNVKLTVNSDKAQKVAVKLFLGPKYDSHGHKIHLEDNFQNFFELDHFIYDIVAGKNVISRSSDEYTYFVKDRTTYFELYQHLMMALKSDDHKFPLDMSEAHCGFPQRLALPRGKKGGMPFQFFFMVMPYYAPSTPQYTGYDPIISCGIGSGARYADNTPFGFPFNRPVESKYFHYDNMYFYDTMIYHKTESEVNAVHH